MPRPAHAMPAVTAVLARGLAAACGIALAAALPQVLGDGPAAWPDWSRPAAAQDVGTELAGPLPYRPEEPGSGRLSEADLVRAVDVIAGLELFFATLAQSDAQSDADSQAGPVWRDSEAAYGAAATTLDSALRNGLFRIAVTEGSKFALVRRGDEVWVDSELAGAWNMERVRRARQEGDDWPDVAALAALLFDHWRIRNAAGTAWLGLQLDRLAVSRAELERGGPAAAAVFTRYGFLKDIYIQAVLLATVTAGSESATLWDERAASIRQDIDTLLRSLATTGLGGDLPTKLRDGWADYRAQVVQTSAERSALIVAAQEPDPTLARIGTVPGKPEREPGPHTGREAVGEPTATERPAPAIEAEPTDAAEARQAGPANEGARDQDYIALLLARAADAARAAEDANRQADALARQADAANLAAEEARVALAAAQSSAGADAESGAAEAARLRQEAADLAGQLDRARGEQATLTERLAEAEDRASAAEAAAAEAKAARQAADGQLAELGSQLAAAQSVAEGTAEQTARLRQEVADLARQLDQANSEQTALTKQLTEAEAARQAADSQVAELGVQLATAQSVAEGTNAETARLRRETADLAGQLDRADSEQAALAAQLAESETRASTAEAATAKAETERHGADNRVAELEAQLAAAQSEAESGAADTATLRQQAADLAAQLAAARTRASAAEASAEAATAQAGERIAALQEQLAARDADLGRAEAQAASQASALTEAGAELGRLERQIAALQGAAGEADSAKAAVTAAQEEARTDAARAANAEATAAAAQETAAAARQDLADREAELASLQDELRALRQAGQAPAQSETAAPPSRASAWRTDWLAPVLAALLLAGGLAALLAVSRRRQAGRAPIGEETRSASRRASEARPKTAPEPRPAAAVEPPAAPRPVRVRAPVEDIPVENVPAVRPVPRRATVRPTPAATVTSATIVEAVRRQDWASADAQFSQLSGVSSPGLKDLLEDPSGELLALACRAADLDRLTFAALYLLQGRGRAVADPEVVASAMGLFEKTGPAEAQRRLAERREGGSLSA